MTDEIRALGGGSAGSQGTGGMVTKLRAAEICMNAGCDMVITNGKRPACLYAILEGRSVGTTFSGR
jgi:glutamate 5-kinase